MSSSRMEQVFYNTHSKVSHYVLRHTSHRVRSAFEHAVLGLAVCAFCVVILSHRTFVHREDIASISNNDGIDRSITCDDAASTNNADGEQQQYGLLGLGFIGEGRGVSMYSIVVQLVRSAYAWMVSSSSKKQQHPPLLSSKKIPASCLKKIPGFREDADVNHILLYYDSGDDDGGEMSHFYHGSRAFTTYQGSNQNEQLIAGRQIQCNSTQQQYQSCIIGTPPGGISRQQRTTSRFSFMKDQAHITQRDCSDDTISFLSHHGYLTVQQNATLRLEEGPTITRQQQYSPILYSYTHSQGLLRLQPSLKHKHNISTQFILASSSDTNCFGDSFAQGIIFGLVGPDTVILNWIIGGLSRATARPRFVYHWKTRKELDLDLFDMDHYAFSSRSSSSGVEMDPNNNNHGAYHESMMMMQQSTTTTSINRIIANVQKYPLYRFLSFLTFKLLVLLSTLLIFFLTTSLVSFTFQETQDRMLEFTLQLQTRVRARMPLGRLILGHVLENLVFVPIMVGMIFFLIEFYGGDKFLAFAVLSMVWVCEVFSAVSIRSAQGMHFFPRVFFLYFTLFHVYFFSCPIGFTYASLASTILFLFHTMLFFWNRYELPALHAGLITPQSPRMTRFATSPPRIQPSSVAMQQTHHHPELPQIPRMTSLDDRSHPTLPTAPMSSTIDFTPLSDQQSLLPPSYPGAMRSYVAAASTSLQSIRSLASIQSLASLAAERTSPNVIFQGGYGFTDPGGTGDESEEDSYMARVSGQSG